MKLKTSLLVATAGLALALGGCKNKNAPSAAKRSDRNLKVKIGDKPVAAGTPSTANVADFDPNGDNVFDFEKWGSDRPDDYQVQQAFFDKFPLLDECLYAEKDRRGSEDQLPGDVALAVKLNPEQHAPFAVHAVLPEDLAENDDLKNCIREAAAKGEYPTYDGPPIVVEFEFELDPGFEE